MGEIDCLYLTAIILDQISQANFSQESSGKYCTVYLKHSTSKTIKGMNETVAYCTTIRTEGIGRIQYSMSLLYVHTHTALMSLSAHHPSRCLCLCDLTVDLYSTHEVLYQSAAGALLSSVYSTVHYSAYVQ